MIKKSSKNSPLILFLIPFIIIGFVFYLVISNLIFGTFLSWPVWLGKGLDYIVSYTIKFKWLQIFVTVFFICFSYLLYKLKKAALIIYGTIEIVGGVFTIWVSLSTNFNDTVLHALAIAGGIFLIVNGIGNYVKGEKIEQEKEKKK